jgi:hypothetical protein
MAFDTLERRWVGALGGAWVGLILRLSFLDVES